MKYNLQTPNSFFIKILFLPLCLLMINAIFFEGYGQQTVKMQDPLFVESYENYYNGLEEASIDIIQSQLRTNIQEFVLTGDHVKTPNYDHKVALVEKELMQQLKKEFCTNGNVQNKPIEKEAIYKILNDLNKKNNLQASKSLYGVITALSVLYLEKVGLTTFCNQ